MIVAYLSYGVDMLYRKSGIVVRENESLFFRKQSTLKEVILAGISFANWLIQNILRELIFENNCF